MNIVRISAGLGNQMFQYALYLSLREVNPDIVIDISEFKYRKHHQGYELEEIFNITPDVASESEVATMVDTSKSFIAEIRRKLFGKRNLSGNHLKESDFDYMAGLDKLTNTYFEGYWQSYRYFEDIEQIVREQFSFKKPLTERNRECATKIEATESVSIHIRRGDYTKSRRWHNIGSICNSDYYNWAMASINASIPDAVYFVFSDDIQWVRENLNIPNATYIDWNVGAASHNDLRLMSLCKHNIIANSSFSWWGAYLNNNEDKIVIAPSKWYRDTPTPNLLPPSWVTIPIDNSVNLKK
ncbi:MAG: alpha-1,2-fucosyltransferase [Bacteroidales bacterium]